MRSRGKRATSAADILTAEMLAYRAWVSNHMRWVLALLTHVRHASSVARTARL
jgi:hypothetical protein